MDGWINDGLMMDGLWMDRHWQACYQIISHFPLAMFLYPIYNDHINNDERSDTDD